MVKQSSYVLCGVYTIAFQRDDLQNLCSNNITELYERIDLMINYGQVGTVANYLNRRLIEEGYQAICFEVLDFIFEEIQKMKPAENANPIK